MLSFNPRTRGGVRLSIMAARNTSLGCFNPRTRGGVRRLRGVHVRLAVDRFNPRTRGGVRLSARYLFAVTM